MTYKINGYTNKSFDCSSIVVLFIFLVLSITPAKLIAQKSPHQQDWEYYKAHPELVGIGEGLQKNIPTYNAPASMSKVVYGFHPYWVSDATASGYYFSLLTHMAYFSADVDTSSATTGGFMTTNSWATSQSITYAKNSGVKVHLAVVMFANHSRVLSSSTNKTNLIKNILTQLSTRSADGAAIDFESMSSSNSTDFRGFIKQLGDSLSAHGKELVVCLPAVDWSGIFSSTFFSTVNSVVSYYFIMAYDYYYRGSANAGPVAPLTTGTSTYHVSRSINTFTNAGATAAKLIAGFPYYGYDWPVVSSVYMAATTASASSVTYANAKTKAATLVSGDKFFDAVYHEPWYRYQDVSSKWHQVWYEDSLSLAMKYDTVKAKGIAGTGMWALSYDGANTELWGALKNSFASSMPGNYTVLDDFESSEGRFANAPTYSGSTVGISTASTAERDITQAKNGLACMKLVLKDNTSSTSSWTVRFLSGGGSPSGNLAVNCDGYYGFWLKTSTAPTGSQAAVLVDDNGTSELSPKITITNDGNWHYYEFNMKGSGWSGFPGTGGNGIVNGPTVTLDAIMLYAPNGSADWTLYIDDMYYVSSGALPVEMSCFSATIRSGQPYLSWETKSEVNTSHFDIERKNANSTQWSKISSLPAAGYSAVARQYNYTDVSALNENYDYRLIVVDRDGSFTVGGYSHIAAIPVKKYALGQNYPNPFNPSCFIEYSLPERSSVNLTVYSITGQRVRDIMHGIQEAGTYKIKFESENLTSGIYFYILEAGKFRQSRKMIILR
ncbi:MAG: glycosyl hydrolase family 18 protein [Ignavibacteria bacterium]|nr:glycosyl hydrolase family 18 protein [Ignavibacteria bacterium]